jgi:predicted lipid-binding transport protein (Tim44 family)
MLVSATNALGLMRLGFGFGRSGGMLGFFILLGIIGLIVWALSRPSRSESTKP